MISTEGLRRPKLLRDHLPMFLLHLFCAQFFPLPYWLLLLLINLWFDHTIVSIFGGILLMLGIFCFFAGFVSSRHVARADLRYLTAGSDDAYFYYQLTFQTEGGQKISENFRAQGEDVAIGVFILYDREQCEKGRARYTSFTYDIWRLPLILICMGYVGILFAHEEFTPNILFVEFEAVLLPLLFMYAMYIPFYLYRHWRLRRAGLIYYS
jgi:hypothetical protein